MFKKFLINKLVDLYKRRYDLVTNTRKHLINYFSKNYLETELNYLDNNYDISKIIYSKSLSRPIIVKFNKNHKFAHSFMQRDLTKLKDVVYNSDNGHIYAIKKSKELMFIAESSSWPRGSIAIEYPKQSIKDMNSLNKLAVGVPNVGFYHLVSEFLPKSILTGQDFLPVAISSKVKKDFVLSLSSIFNLNACQIPKWNYIEELTFITGTNDVGYLHPDDLTLLNKSGVTEHKKSKMFQNIYVSRQNSRRSSLNEKFLHEELKKIGFHIIFPEQLKLEDQISIFRNAKVVVGIHGAGLVNIVWGKQTHLIELMPNNRVNKCYEWITNLNGGKYSRLDFKPFDRNISAIFHQILTLIDYTEN